MNTLQKALAGIFTATAMVTGTAVGQVIYDSTPRYVQSASTGVIDSIEAVRESGGSRGDRAAGTILGGIVGGVLGHQIGSGRGNDVATVAGALGGAAVGHNLAENRGHSTSYRVNVRMDDGGFRTFYQSDVYGLNVGDRVQVDADHVIRYSGTYRYEPAPYRYSSEPRYEPRYSTESYPVYRSSTIVYAEPEVRYTRDGRIDRRVYHYDSLGYRVDQWGNRYDAEGFWVDELGHRHEYQDPPMPEELPPSTKMNRPQ